MRERDLFGSPAADWIGGIDSARDGRISDRAIVAQDWLAAHVALVLAGAATVAVGAMGLFLANGAGARLLM